MAFAEDSAFEIQFVRVGWKDGIDMTRKPSKMPVEFQIKRENQAYDVAVYVDTATTPEDEYIRHARHLLHLYFVQLAEQTKKYRRPDHEFGPARSDPIPF